MALIYPKATTVDIQSRDGGAMVGGPPRGVIHTTETNPKWGFFTSKWYYSVQFLLRPGSSKVEILQTFDLARASRALFNGPHSVQTNRMGNYCPNLVIIGYAKDSPVLPVPLIAAISEFIVWAEDTLHIPAHFPLTFQGGEAYGTSGVGRMSIPEWEDFSGWCGHQDVPDGNSHWDPGAIPTDKFRQAINALKGGSSMASYKGVINVPHSNGKVIDWVTRVIDRHIQRGIIVNDDDAVDDWSRDGRLWIFLDRTLVPIEAELRDKDRKIKNLDSRLTKLSNEVASDSTGGGITSGTEFLARVV